VEVSITGVVDGVSTWTEVAVVVTAELPGSVVWLCPVCGGVGGGEGGGEVLDER